jgi:hypothetical protein
MPIRRQHAHRGIPKIAAADGGQGSGA